MRPSTFQRLRPVLFFVGLACMLPSLPAAPPQPIEVALWPEQPPHAAEGDTPGAAPAFISSAEDDKTAPVSFARDIAAAYRNADADCLLWVVERGGHGAFTIDTPGEGGKWIDHFWPWLETLGIRP